MKDVIFIAIALVTLGGALFTAFNKSIINAALGLLLSLVGTAGIYIYLSADFLAVSQILIYVGGVMVVILFSIMLTSGGGQVFSNNPAMSLLPAILLVTGFGAIYFYTTWNTDFTFFKNEYTPTTKMIGNMLLKEYIAVFELVSVLIVVLLVGAGVFLRKELVLKDSSKSEEESEE